MPRQEIFLAVKQGDEVVEVVKTYDETLAREAFRNMDDAALTYLATSLKPESIYDAGDLPKFGETDYEDFIWDTMVDNAREDWKTFSYFVVTKSAGGKMKDLFVSGDWPTAEAYVRLIGTPEAATSQSIA